MHSTETVSQRRSRAIMFGEEFYEKRALYTEFFNALSERLDPVQIAVILAFKERIVEYERCVADIIASGFSVDECMKAYDMHLAQTERSAS